MKKKDVFQMRAGMEAVQKYTGMKFRYAFAKNMKLINEEIEALQSVIQPSEKVKEFNKEAEELKISFAKKDGAGNPVIDNNMYVMTDNSAFESAYKDLEAKYADAFDERNKTQKEYEDLLNTPIECKFHMVKDADIDPAMTAGEYEKISFMIEE